VTTEALGFEGILNQIPQSGLVLEFGVFNGVSFDQICGLVYPRHVYGFDSFYGLPEDWNKSYPRGKFSRGGIPPPVQHPNGEVVVGLIQHTLDEFLAAHPGPVAFAHFDMDIYSSTIYALTKLADRFVHGSICLFDEYADEIDGRDHEQKAFLEFLENNPKIRAKFIGKRVWHAYAFRLEKR
jgi:hypothetical protein